MKKQNTALYILRLALTLLAITAIMAAALAWVNQITAPYIEQIQKEKLLAAIDTVLPERGEAKANIWVLDENSIVENLYIYELGYAVEVKPIGFDNTITMMVGIDRDFNVLGISIVSHTETAGLGAVAAAKNSAGEAFRDQFVGMSGQLAVTKDGGEVDALTGATITSRAICAGINAALECARNCGF